MKFITIEYVRVIFDTSTSLKNVIYMTNALKMSATKDNLITEIMNLVYGLPINTHALLKFKTQHI